MLAAHADLLALQHEAAEIERSLSGDLPEDELGRLVDRHAEVLARFEARGGYRVEAEIHKILAGLGFRQDDLTKRTDQFSGGWRTRIALAKLLVRAPDLLLLDEPTNHLDLEATEWLEQYLKASGASAIVVSHDRYFLDRMISRTVELERGQACRVRRQLLLLPGREGAPLRRRPDRLRAPAARAEAPARVHRPVPRQGDQGDPGQEPREGAGEGRAGRGAEGRVARDGAALPAGQAVPPRGRHAPEPRQAVRPADDLRRAGADAGARRAAGAGRPERLREEHAAADAGRGGAAGPGHAAARRWRHGRVLRPGPDGRAERRADAPGGGLGRRSRRLGRGRHPDAARAVRLHRRRRPQAGRRALGRREGPARPSPGCCSSRPTCCCWTSRPTTWTWLRARSWSGRCASSRARW